jgi:hypothetical protein
LLGEAICQLLLDARPLEMILNSYALLDGFTTILRIILSVLVIALSTIELRRWYRLAPDGEVQRLVEERSHLLFLVAAILLLLNVLSWPLLYLLLQSYVSQWPGVMCIYGVTRIGAGSLGPSRFLPSLLTALQITKPLLVFLSGTWVLLHWLNRQTRTATLSGRVTWAVFLTGILAAGDALAEGLYLLLPKKEQFPATGCCTAVFDSASAPNRFLPTALVRDSDAPIVLILYVAANIALLIALAGAIWANPKNRFGVRLLPVLALCAVSVIFSSLFLTEFAAPRLLHLPNHHCPYDLIPKAPESILAVALYFGGSFALGWACIASLLGKQAESEPFLPELARGLVQFAFYAFLGSLAIMSLELVMS